MCKTKWNEDKPNGVSITCIELIFSFYCGENHVHVLEQFTQN